MLEGVGVIVNVAVGVGEWAGGCVNVGVAEPVEVGVWAGVPVIVAVEVGEGGMVSSGYSFKIIGQKI